MVKIIANAVGLAAVVLYVVSYQFKKRSSIVIVNIFSRVFYVLQYILLSAFSGAGMDVTGLIVSLLAQRKDRGIIKKYKRLFIVFSAVLIVLIGIVFYKNVYSILPIFAVIFEAGALWFTKEKHIRIVSLISIPFWLTYNLLCSAYAAAAGSVFAFVSITLALIRYDIKKEH